ncbi:hypothetical protein GCM10023093_29960 [Nemorincola caseinilytica]|uniref:MerC domain-containing protein n=1 Tax=Nemorincola caseinilytica TaxID=2054315 RepID=A0ABP8NRD4_9BACT
MHSSRYFSGADKLGIASAVICAVHCLVIPAIFLIKYSWADSVADVHAGHHAGLPAWWHVLDYVFLVVGFVAVLHASSHAPARGVKLSLWFFWLCLAVAVVFEEQLHWMTYLASAGLIATHFFNIRSHRNTRHAQASDMADK